MAEGTPAYIGSTIATSYGAATATYVRGNTNSLEANTFGASTPADTRCPDVSQQADFHLARVEALAFPPRVPPDRAQVVFVAEWQRFKVEQELTRAFDAHKVQAVTIASQEQLEASCAPLPGSLPDRVRLPAEAARPAERDDTIDLRWDPLDYKVALAIEKYFQQDDANPDRC